MHNQAWQTLGIVIRCYANALYMSIHIIEHNQLIMNVVSIVADVHVNVVESYSMHVC